jgi:hypothetical protein
MDQKEKSRVLIVEIENGYLVFDGDNQYVNSKTWVAKDLDGVYDILKERFEGIIR